MAEYMRLPSTSSVEDDDEYKEASSVPQVPHGREGSRFDSLLLASLIAMLAIIAAGAFHLSVLTAPSGIQRLPSTREVVASLVLGDLNKNLDAGRVIIRHNSKTLHPTSGKMWFPAAMNRVNAEEPDTTYTAGSHVILSPSDSMIYQWLFNSSWPKCYISGWVSPLAKLIEGGKTYSAEGDVTEIEVWNVDYPSDSNLPSLSWNTRPTRQSLHGTVNFTDNDVQRQLFQSDGKELKSPTPLFDCVDRRTITVEIACKACRLEFDQVFSDPALGFELIELA